MFQVIKPVEADDEEAENRQSQMTDSAPTDKSACCLIAYIKLWCSDARDCIQPILEQMVANIDATFEAVVEVCREVRGACGGGDEGENSAHGFSAVCTRFAAAQSAKLLKQQV